ncbi:uncharacterized protein LOC119358354 [Triticum dicoccoides]|uniref:uncharacterized protein LOC119358354 n=1 Tax=Triticum dicoccoides TaxID=85692 RepID=UPI00188DFEE7|nr:uncharacterized protein LOC119358354 [Triticum dicoccoides]
MKGRYFPDGDFWNSKCPRAASYTWRSIMYGKELLRRGLLWRVGDGKQISIIRDNWIPDTIHGTMQTLIPVEDNQIVSSLISSNGSTWKEDTVRELFDRDIAERILKIPLSSEGCSDFASWPYTKNGIYTVRSGYNLVRTNQFWINRSSVGSGSSSNQDVMQKLWKNLWRIQCPDKMKIVLWRIAHNCLPTGDQLHKRSIATRSAGSNRREHQVSIPKWSPPPAESVKVNVDAVIFAQTKRMGIGVVIRNHLGRVLAASRGFIHHVDNPELGEAIAMRHALFFAEDSGFQKILVETDCASLINKIKSKMDDRSHTGAVIFDIKSRAPRFLSCCFTHVSRSCNEAAHVLAKSAEHDEGSCWFNVSPEVIRNIVCTEQF